MQNTNYETIAGRSRHPGEAEACGLLFQGVWHLKQPWWERRFAGPTLAKEGRCMRLGQQDQQPQLL